MTMTLSLKRFQMRFTTIRVAVSCATLCAILLTACGTEEADLVLLSGKIVTVDETVPEAEAIAMAGERILAVGTNEEMEQFIGSSTEVIRIDGLLALPGFIEGHGHFTSLGQALMVLDLTKASSWDEIVGMVAEAAQAADDGEWILGRGWHQDKWDIPPQPSVEGLPLHRGLTRVSPNNPVFLTHASGHASFANALALELAGITSETADPPGGEIVHDRSGNPTGALREKAQLSVREAIARADSNKTQEELEAQALQIIELASQEALSKGITTFHDAGASFETIDRFKRVAEAGDLPIRLYAMVRYQTNEEMQERLPEYRLIDFANSYLTVRSIKRQIDGALGAHGAWLLEPYVDLPTSTGLVLEPLEEIERTAEIAIEYGFQVNTHAIGDRANRETLDIYERVLNAHPEKTDLRWRIEHAQHLHPDDVPRFAELGVIAAMQAIHCTSDGPWVHTRLGREREAEGAYLWHTLLESGAVVTNGTDVPVEDIDPIPVFHASVTRQVADGSYYYPEERMSREEALYSYTMANAFAAFEEESKGSLTPGKLADVVVVSKDIMTVPEDEILDAEVVYTIVGGKIRYRNEAARN
jgi:predicted amidohydrolase YtcJ